VSGLSRPPGPFAVIGVSVAALAAGTFSIVAIGALAPDLEAALGLSRAEIGLLTSLVFIGAALSSRRGGALTDSFGPARVLGLSLAAFGAAMAVAAAAPTAVVFMLAVLAAGIAYGGINPPTNVVVAGQLVRRLGFFLSLKQSGVPLGGLLAGLVLPAVATAFGWRWAFGLAVAVCFAVAATTPLLRNAAVLRPREGRPALPDPNRRHLIAVGVFGFLMSGTQWTFLTYLTLYLTGERGFSLAEAGLALALAQGLGAVGRLLWGHLSDARGRRLRVLLTMVGLALASLALLATDPGSRLTWPLVAVSGFAIVGWNGAYYALVAEQAGPGRVGRASGEALFFVFGGAVLVPPLLGVLADASGSWQPLWAAAAAGVALAGAALWAGLRVVTPVLEAPTPT
jgi:MFS family permease